MRDGAVNLPVVSAWSCATSPERRNRSGFAGLPKSDGCSSAALGSAMAAASMPLLGVSTPALGICCGGGACARPATGAKAVAATAAAIRDRRNIRDLPAPKRAPARSVTSEAAKPTYLRRPRAKRQPPGRRMAVEG